MEELQQLKQRMQAVREALSEVAGEMSTGLEGLGADIRDLKARCAVLEGRVPSAEEIGALATEMSNVEGQVTRLGSIAVEITALDAQTASTPAPGGGTP